MFTMFQNLYTMTYMARGISGNKYSFYSAILYQLLQ